MEKILKELSLLLKKERSLIEARPFDPEGFQENMSLLERELEKLRAAVGERPLREEPPEVLRLWEEVLRQRRENRELLQERCRELSREMETLYRGRKTIGAYRSEDREALFIKDLA
ncbi:MAG TPA: hypothetical protein PKO38_00490 [Bacillota bacterium]|jgi:hypothetical protein|nr:hypothetical protein [Bacillota bacterium]HOB86150.1 hypothetical protein [Bacillota bacterium]HOP68861.1 hypothetical protein [Bacillota bacterium]HPT33368.1 hypothetical protein [Bacillota bacterium]HPZ64328.1 hypothetical protein [Bacillota bacterium]